MIVELLDLQRNKTESQMTLIGLQLKDDAACSREATVMYKWGQFGTLKVPYETPPTSRILRYHGRDGHNAQLCPNLYALLVTGCQRQLSSIDMSLYCYEQDPRPRQDRLQDRLNNGLGYSSTPTATMSI